MNQTVSWLSCAVAGTLTRSVVHFFPSAGGVSVPYPAQCTLSLFGNGAEPRSVVLEGARLSQPDGLWLDDAFPQIRDTAGLYGLFIELKTAQPRVDMQASGCVMEFHSSLHLNRFWPARLLKAGTAQRRGALPLIQDGFQTTSVVVVNGSSQGVRPALKTTALQRGGGVVSAALAMPTIEPYSVAEVPVPGAFFDELVPQECGYGLLRVAGVELETALPEAVTVFVMYRDPSDNHPVSVCGL